MPVANELRSETLGVLKPAENRARVLENTKNKQSVKKTTTRKKVINEVPPQIASLDSSCSSDWSSGGDPAVKPAVTSKGRVKREKVVEDKGIWGNSSRVVSEPVKRCDWITPNSADPLYNSFHDEEWGVPVYDDIKLFELLVLCIALAEFTWPTILNKQHVFRKVFNNFDTSSISKITDEEIALLISNGRSLLSEPKLRAVVENAKQTLKIQQEFGSFCSYLWSFVSHKPIRNGFKYGRQVPKKSPKAEHLSKDLMIRGFRCVGPSVVYSFMQVAGLVNDHLVTCFRYQECNKTDKIEDSN